MTLCVILFRWSQSLMPKPGAKPRAATFSLQGPSWVQPCSRINNSHFIFFSLSQSCMLWWMHQFIYTANMYFVWTARLELYEADIVNNWWFVASRYKADRCFLWHQTESRFTLGWKRIKTISFSVMVFRLPFTLMTQHLTGFLSVCPVGGGPSSCRGFQREAS